MQNDLLHEVGNRVRELREEKKFSQEQLANLCNTDASYIRKLESGRLNISVRRLYHICGALGVTLDMFFGGIGTNVK